MHINCQGAVTISQFFWELNCLILIEKHCRSWCVKSYWQVCSFASRFLIYLSLENSVLCKEKQPSDSRVCLQWGAVMFSARMMSSQWLRVTPSEKLFERGCGGAILASSCGLNHWHYMLLRIYNGSAQTKNAKDKGVCTLAGLWFFLFIFWLNYVYAFEVGTKIFIV